MNEPRDQLARLELLFYAAIELPQSHRLQFLRDECAEDKVLLSHLMDLVREHEADSVQESKSAVGVTGEHSLAPRSIGPYKVIRELGHGSMGSVYLATQETPRREVAIKVIRAAAATLSANRRFVNEAQMMAMMRHPNIANVYEHGVFVDELGTSRHYIAMEYVPGQPLHEYLKHAEMSLRDRVQFVANICGAVGYAHKKGILHRDLKPANILVVGNYRIDGEQGEVDFRIVDFGVGKAEVSGHETAMTGAGMVIGSIPYISPEMLSGDGMADSRADIYSLGVMAYEIITSHYPIEADWRRLPFAQCCRLICEGDVVPARKLRGDIDADLEAILLRAVERDVCRRYVTAEEMQEDLRRYLKGMPVLAAPLTALRVFVKWYRRERAMVRVVAIMVVCVVLAGTSGIYTAVVSRERSNLLATAAGERLTRRQTEIVAIGLLSVSRGGESIVSHVNAGPNLDVAMDEQIRSIIDGQDVSAEERVLLLNTVIWVGVVSGSLEEAGEARRLAGELLSESQLGHTSVEAEYLLFSAWHELLHGDCERAKMLLQAGWDAVMDSGEPKGEGACIANIVASEIEIRARNFERAKELAIAAESCRWGRSRYLLPISELIRTQRHRIAQGAERSTSGGDNGS